MLCDAHMVGVQEEGMTSSPDVCPGSCLLNIVVVEHLRFALPGDTDPNGKLFAVLQDAKVISFTTCGSQVQPCLAIRYWSLV
jgi:hypothetical protein